MERNDAGSEVINPVSVIEFKCKEGNDKILHKEELGKLTDSACESLNDSEESCSKYQDNVTASDIVSVDKDSLGCEEDPQLSESGDDASVDNNTFNVNNTETSDSQEISELSNEDSNRENGVLNDVSGETEQNNNSCSQDTTTGTSSSSSPSSESAISGSLENNEDSVDNSAEVDEFNDSLDEEESPKSKITEDSASQSDSVFDKIEEQSSTDNADTSISEENGKIAEDDSKNLISNLIPVQQPPISKSPNVARKLKLNKNDFTIEIFESKRKTDLPIISQVTADNETIKIEHLISNVDENEENNSDLDKNVESPHSSDKPLSLETASPPDSADKSSSIFLDISQPIKEESEQSDELSPIISIAEENSSMSNEVLVPVLTCADTTGTSRKPVQEPSKIYQNANSELGQKSSFCGTNNSTAVKKSNPNNPESCVQTLPSSASKNDSQKCPSGSSEGATKKLGPMAFTVELGDSAASDSSGSGSTGKKLEISASISQWVPKHRRNLSLSKVEENKKVEEKPSTGTGSDKPPLGRPRSGTVGATSLGLKRGGYHSEGYFSSDQDEDSPKRTELKSPRSQRVPPLENIRSPLAKSPVHQDTSKGNSVRMRPPSPASSPYGVPLNESASYLIERIMNTPETKRKHAPKPEGRACCKERERKPSVSELTGKTYKVDKNKMGTDSKKQARNTPTDDLDLLRDEKDDVSEAGTYTIDKDSPSPEVEQEARSDNDAVFGLESEAELTSSTAVPVSTTDQCHEDESSWMSASEITPAISRNSPNWIHQWAAQVAEQTKPPVEAISSHSKATLPSLRGNKQPLASQESPDCRPRRKLPTVPSHLPSNHQRSIDTSDSETLKSRLWRDSTLSTDQTSDAECFNPHENIMTSSLQARVTKVVNPAFRNTSFESHESGGDSDIDLGNSYQFNDDERLTTSLRNKLKLNGLHLSPKSHRHSPSAPTLATSSSRSPNLIKDSRMLNREATYDIFQSRREELPLLQSDSSSETSDPYKDIPTPPRPSDNNPPLKFNRAFSLRRGRLGCDEPVVTNEKKKSIRPTSAGATTSARNRTSLGATKSYQSVDNPPSVSSPRGYGLLSPRTIASSTHNSVGGSKATGVASSSDSFDRTDGGRFSLRLQRVGATSIGLVKSPSKSSIARKEVSKKNGNRSNSTLTSKDVDLQNWKRRKNYDPMKAAAEGRKKQVEKKKVDGQPSELDDRSLSPAGGSLLRSASFHGTDGGMMSAQWNRKRNISNHQPHYTSEDEGPYSLEEDLGPHPSPRRVSPLHRSPTSPHQLCPSPARQQKTSILARARRPSLGLANENEAQYKIATRKISMDESGSEGKRSPLHQGSRAIANSSIVVARPKTKMEALDNLVISTIHSLSSKVRTTSESLLQKLKSQYNEEGDRAALLEEVLSHLSESDQSSGQTRSTSRELAGILRNLKKIENALGVIDRVIIVGDDEYPEDDDLIDEVPQDWVESDY